MPLGEAKSHCRLWLALLTSSASYSPTDCSQQAPHPPELPNSCTQTHCTKYLLHLQKEILLFTTHILVVQSLSHVQLFATPWTAGSQASLSFTVSRNLLKLMSIESVMPSNHLILCFPLLPSISLSIRVFSNEWALHIRCSEYWSSTSVLPMNMQDWFPLGLIGLISLLSKGPSRVFSSTKHILSLCFGALQWLLLRDF